MTVIWENSASVLRP